MKQIKYCILLIFLVLRVAFVWAQASVSLGLSSRIIGRDEMVQVEYAVKNVTNVSSMSNLSFPGWVVVSGPQVSQQMVSINGHVQRSISYIYILKPSRKGNLLVPGASFIADGHRLSCPSSIVSVTGHTSSGASAQQPQTAAPRSLQAILDQLEKESDADEAGSNVLRPGETAEQRIRKNMFIQVMPSKRRVYVGEPVLVTYKLVSALGGQSRITKQPSFNGVGVVDMTQNTDPEPMTINGKSYRAFLIRKVQLTPLQAGKIDLGYAETSNDVPFVRYDDPYHPKTYTVALHNEPASIEAVPLPTAGRPADFSGAIGNFVLTARPDKNSSAAGDNNVLHLQIEGKGSLQGIRQPLVNWPAGIQAYDGTDSQHLDKSVFPQPVIKYFDIPFVGSKEGDITIPSISFSFFDPESGTYKTVHSLPVTVHFTPPLPKSVLDQKLFSDGVGNKKYLWIIALAAMILIAVYGINRSRDKKRKKKAAPSPDKSPEEMEADAPWMHTDTQHTEKAPVPPLVPKEQPEELTTQPPALPAGGDSVAENTTNYAEALQEIQLSTDKSQFFNLAKALATQALQDYESNHETDVSLLVKGLQEKVPERPELAKEAEQLFRLADKGLYSPVTDEGDNAKMMDALSSLLRNLGRKV